MVWSVGKEGKIERSERISEVLESVTDDIGKIFNKLQQFLAYPKGTQKMAEKPEKLCNGK